MREGERGEMLDCTTQCLICILSELELPFYSLLCLNSDAAAFKASRHYIELSCD